MTKKGGGSRKEDQLWKGLIQEKRESHAIIKPKVWFFWAVSGPFFAGVFWGVGERGKREMGGKEFAGLGGPWYRRSELLVWLLTQLYGQEQKLKGRKKGEGLYSPRQGGKGVNKPACGN